MNYYNEFEPFAAEWLKELIKDGLIPDGEVDTRSIVDVAPEDLKDFKQCHFFAGIGGWAYAARLAGWGDDRPMWTGSPPCQPFSTAGKQDGASDERHLWPVWFNLLRECRPPIVFGEQVSAAITFGWLDQLQADLESSDYSCGAIIVPASGVGALHQRERLWFVADRNEQGSQGGICRGQDTERRLEYGYSGCSSTTDRLADSNDIGHEWNQKAGREAERRAEYAGNGCSRTVGDTEHSGSHGSEERRGNEEAGSGSAQGQDISLQSQGASGCSESGDLRRVGVPLADTGCNVQGIQPRDNGKKEEVSKGKRESEHRTNVSDGRSKSDGRQEVCGSDGVHRGFWNGVQAVQCKDGKVRAIPTEPEIFPLADGIPNRVGTLRGAGNAIVPQVAAEIIGLFR